MKIFLNVFFAVLILCSSLSYSQNLDDIKTKIAEIDAKLEKSMLTNDPMSTLDLYAENCYSLSSYMPMIKGKTELKKGAEMQLANPTKWTQFDLETVDVITSGNLVIEIGTYVMAMEIPQMPEPWKDNGKYMNVYEIQSDGSLLIVVDTWNSDNNPWMEMQKMMQPAAPQEK
ncbi:MAG: DUF4440 domain-containing protein [bacterium]